MTFPKSLTIPGPGNHKSFSKSVSAFLFCNWVNLYHFFLDSTYKGCHMLFLLLCLTYFTQYATLWVHPCCCKWPYFIFFSGWVVFHWFSRQEHWSGLPFPSPMHESEKWKWKWSHVRLLVTPWTAAHQAPPSLGFSRQEPWSGLPFSSPVHESEKWKWRWSVVLTPSDPMDCSLPGSSIHGTFQAINPLIFQMFSFLPLESFIH